MAYQYEQTYKNVSLIDNVFFGFPRFCASYLVKGSERLALVDCGAPPSLDIVRKAINDLGFAVSDIDYIFVTHAEHPDHAGNVGALLQENSKATVFVHPAGVEFLTNPEIEENTRDAVLPAKMAARFGHMVPVPRERIHVLSDGETVELGGGESLKNIFTPGHQPSGIVIYDNALNSLFINDLCGQSLTEFGLKLILTPNRANIFEARASLTSLLNEDYERLFLGHFGISDDSKGIIQGAIDKIDEYIAAADHAVSVGAPIGATVRERVVQPEIDKARPVREPEFYAYLNEELATSLCAAFEKHYLDFKGGN